MRSDGYSLKTMRMQLHKFIINNKSLQNGRDIREYKTKEIQIQNNG